MELGLILDHWDLFAEGVWRTINLVSLALFFGLILAIPMAWSGPIAIPCSIPRSGPSPTCFAARRCWCRPT